MARAIRNAIRAKRFAIETPIFIACQADSPESLEFPIRAKHPIRAIRANRFARITPLSRRGMPTILGVNFLGPEARDKKDKFVGKMEGNFPQIHQMAGSCKLSTVPNVSGNRVFICHKLWAFSSQKQKKASKK